MMHSCPDGTHSRLERRGPSGTLTGVTFRCPRCGYQRSALQLDLDFKAIRPLLERRLSGRS